MLIFNSTTTAPSVRYFYLSANHAKQAEIIQVINSGSAVVQVPMREEDIELTAFFERELTPAEKTAYKTSETWKVFTCWEELYHDHVQFCLKHDVAGALLSLRYRYPLQEEMAVSA